MPANTLPIGPVAIGLSVFALLYPMMLSDFVSHDTRAGAGRSTDQRPFTATGKAADQRSGGRCAAYGFGSVVMTLIMGILGCFRPLVFPLGHLLRSTVLQRRRLQDWTLRRHNVGGSGGHL